MPFTDIFASDFRFPARVCILAPGPNGREHYADIPPDTYTIAVSKAVLIPDVNPAVWMMNHVHQDWYPDANCGFHGIRVFAYQAVMQAQAKHDQQPQTDRDSPDYYFIPPSDDFLDDPVQEPVAGVIRFGATVSACAVQLAYNFGARDILLCGVDMEGDGYFDGSLNVHPNHGQTWPAAQRLSALITWLQTKQGLRVHSLSPTQLDVPVDQPA